MRWFKLLSIGFIFLLVANQGMAYDLPADGIAPDTSNFDNRLSASDSDLQTALETLDDVVIGSADINWEDVDNLEIQSAGINWIDVDNLEIQTAGINWGSVINEEIQNAGINWASTNSDNWDTAYGWGDHSGLYWRQSSADTGLTGDKTGSFNLTTTGKGTFGDLDVDTLNLNGNSITDSTGEIDFGDEDLVTTGTVELGATTGNPVDAQLTINSGELEDDTNPFIDFAGIYNPGGGTTLRTKGSNGIDAVYWDIENGIYNGVLGSSELKINSVGSNSSFDIYNPDATHGMDVTIGESGDNSSLTVNGDVTSTGDVTGDNLSGTNTGDQTSIVGITGTKSQFNTACTDGTFAYSGGAFHDGFSDFVANEHIDWTNASDNFVTTGTAEVGATSGTVGAQLIVNSGETNDTADLIEFPQVYVASGDFKLKATGFNGAATAWEIEGGTYTGDVGFTEIDSPGLSGNSDFKIYNSSATFGVDFVVGEAGDGSSLTVYGDIDSTKKISSGTTTLSAVGPTDNLDVSGANTVFIDASGNSVTLGGVTGGVDGQVLHIAVKNIAVGNSATIEDQEGTGNQDFYTTTGGDEVLTNAYGGWTFVCDGSNWYSVNGN